MRYKLFIYLSLIILPTYIVAEYRSLDGSNNNIAIPNAGIPNVPYFRQKPNNEKYAGDNGEMIPSPGNYVLNVKAPTCKDPRAKGIFPLPRCISNVLDSYQLTKEYAFSWNLLDSFKSKRKVSHMV